MEHTHHSLKIALTNPFVFVGICPVSLNRWGYRLWAGIVPAGEAQWQVHKHRELVCIQFSFDAMCEWSIFLILQIPKEAGSDVLCFPEPGWDEWRGGAAVQLPAHTEEAHSECRLCGEQPLQSTPYKMTWKCVFLTSSGLILIRPIEQELKVNSLRKTGTLFYWKWCHICIRPARLIVIKSQSQFSLLERLW